MRKLLLSILLLFCSFVSDANKSIIGKYSMRFGVEGDDLTLYRNHVFRIYSANFEGEHPSISKGKWTQSKDTIILFYQSIQYLKLHSNKLESKATMRRDSLILVIKDLKLCSEKRGSCFEKIN